MNSKPDRLVGCLEYSPDIAHWLGVFVGEFAAIELMLVRLMAIVLDEDDEMKISHSILGRIRNITERVNIVADAVKRSKLKQETIDQIAQFTDEIVKLNALRNKYVHGLYETNLATGEVILTPWATTNVRPTGKPTIVTVAEIKRDAMLVRRLHGRIAKTLLS